MVENKITKLKILIDKHFENIENIINISKHTPNFDNESIEHFENIENIINISKHTPNVDNESIELLELDQLLQVEITQNEIFYKIYNDLDKIKEYIINKNYYEILKEINFTIEKSLILENPKSINKRLIDLLNKYKKNYETAPELKRMMHEIINNIIIIFNEKNDKYNKEMESNERFQKSRGMGPREEFNYRYVKFLPIETIQEIMTIFYNNEKYKLGDNYININNNIQILNDRLFELEDETSKIKIIEPFNIKEIMFQLYKLKVLFIISNPFISSIIENNEFIVDCKNFCQENYNEFIKNFKDENLINYNFNSIDNYKKIIIDFSDIIKNIIEKCIKNIDCYVYLDFLGISYPDNLKRCALKNKFNDLDKYFLRNNKNR